MLKPDILIMDINIPYVNGIEVSKKVKKVFPETQVIILTAYGEFEYAKKAIQYGVSEYLLKPVTAICWMNFPLILFSGLRPVRCFLKLPPSLVYHL